MTPAERLVLLLVADLVLASDGYSPLSLAEALRQRLRDARIAFDAEAFRGAQEPPA